MGQRIRPSDNTASRFIAPPAMVRIANNRTSPIRRAWVAEIAWKPADFAMLAESCYMQGGERYDPSRNHAWMDTAHRRFARLAGWRDAAGRSRGFTWVVNQPINPYALVLSENMSKSVSDAAAKLAKARWNTTGTTEKHSDAARRNGKLGGRPRVTEPCCGKCGQVCSSAASARAHCKKIK